MEPKSLIAILKPFFNIKGAKMQLLLMIMVIINILTKTVYWWIFAIIIFFTIITSKTPLKSFITYAVLILIGLFWGCVWGVQMQIQQISDLIFGLRGLSAWHTLGYIVTYATTAAGFRVLQEKYSAK